MKELIDHYHPEVLVLQDYAAEDSRRAPRVQNLGERIIALASGCGVKVKLFTREQVTPVFFADGRRTKHQLAEVLAKRFPKELGLRLPPKRRPWMSEDSRMHLFDAVGLALMLVLRRTKRTARKA